MHLNVKLPSPKKAKLAPKVEDADETVARGPAGHLIFPDHPEFTPNLTPKQVLHMGSFGGTYYRTIKSSVTGKLYDGREVIKEFPESWFTGINKVKMVHSKSYDPRVNKYGTQCGGGLDMWEEKGWIDPQDPYGWFMWYCRFYTGRRTKDDTNSTMGRSNRTQWAVAKQSHRQMRTAM